MVRRKVEMGYRIKFLEQILNLNQVLADYTTKFKDNYETMEL